VKPPLVKYSKLNKAVFLICIAVFTYLTTTTAYALPTTDLRLIYEGKVSSVKAPNELKMDDGKKYLLSYIDVSKESLEKFQNKKVYLYSESAQDDRYGRAYVVASYKKSDGSTSSIQEDVISSGKSLIYISKENTKFVKDLEKLEASAKDSKQGLWNSYNVATPDNVVQYIHTYQIVEGKILDAHESDKYVFLNFGEDWKTDFTIRIDKKYWQKISNDYYNINKSEDLNGAEVRVRGFIEDTNGPMINLRYKEQMLIVKSAK